MVEPGDPDEFEYRTGGGPGASGKQPVSSEARENAAREGSAGTVREDIPGSAVDVLRAICRTVGSCIWRILYSVDAR